MIDWDVPFKTVRSGGFENGDVAWFNEGRLNAAYNCVDRWAHKYPDRVAIIYEADEPGQHQEITYSQLLVQVSQAANMLKALGVKKGDTVIVLPPHDPRGRRGAARLCSYRCRPLGRLCWFLGGLAA